MSDPTLPAVLERRFGIAPRVTWGAAAALVLLGVAVFLLTRDPDDGLQRFTHDGTPAFTLLAPQDAERVASRPGELLRLRAHRGGQTVTVGVRALHLPGYAGSATGILPVYATAQAAGTVIDDQRADLRDAPGYQVHTSAGPGDDTVDLYAVPRSPDRDGVVVTFHQTKPAAGLNAGGRRLAQAMRSVLRSLQFGTGRS
ncbi:MAG: hypothetical protein QOF76_3205 [Solirubrobacteraceae bacterium]|nr:hypothetical protein [Solirubrobacteraceae bacterium]